jgi:hypothetical protein
MYLEMMRRGIEFDAELAFSNMPEPEAYQTNWDVIDATFGRFFDKFMHMTEGHDTEEVIEQRNLLLTNLKNIAISNNFLTTSIHDHVEALRQNTFDLHRNKLIFDPPLSPSL